MKNLPSCSDYVSSIENPQLIKAAQLFGGSPVFNNGKIEHYTGGFCIVFPFNVQGKKYALRCWHASIANAQDRTRLIAEELTRIKLPFFVGFEYVENGIITTKGIQPIVVMDWADGMLLKEYISANIKESEILIKLSVSFLNMVKQLHKKNISHGDLQHGNILVRSDGSLILVDYDSMYVPALDGYEEDIKGLKGYQHEARWNNKFLTPKADFFSELVIYTSIVALAHFSHLWCDLNIENTDCLLFSEEDIKYPKTSSVFRLLESNGELAPLANKLKEFITYSSIDCLQPLEDVVPKPIVETISDKWSSNNGYIKAHEKSPSLNHVGNGWGKRPISNLGDSSIEISSTQNKWL